MSNATKTLSTLGLLVVLSTYGTAHGMTQCPGTYALEDCTAIIDVCREIDGGNAYECALGPVGSQLTAIYDSTYGPFIWGEVRYNGLVFPFCCDAGDLTQGSRDLYVYGSDVADDISLRYFSNRWQSNSVIEGFDGDDLLTGSNDPNTSDVILGGEGNDMIFGLAGDDELWGEEGDDEVYGAEGDDIIRGGTGHDYVNGNDGQDTIYGGPGSDTLCGPYEGTYDEIDGGPWRGTDHCYGGVLDMLLSVNCIRHYSSCPTP